MIHNYIHNIGRYYISVVIMCRNNQQRCNMYEIENTRNMYSYA